MTAPRTIIDKIWDAHCVREETFDAPAILYVDLHLVHEVTSPQAFSELATRGIGVRRGGLRTLAGRRRRGRGRCRSRRREVERR